MSVRTLGVKLCHQYGDDPIAQTLEPIKKEEVKKEPEQAQS